jgi:hypothetical protein
MFTPETGSGSGFFPHPGSRSRKSTGSRIRIRNTAKTWLRIRTRLNLDPEPNSPNTDPQHWPGHVPKNLTTDLDEVEWVSLVQGHDAEEAILCLGAGRSPVKRHLLFSTSLQYRYTFITTSASKI